MATTFEIIIAGEARDYAAHAARAAFAELDRLEGELSRFRPQSEMARLSAASPGEWVPLTPDGMRCLALAQFVWSETQGAYDPTLGAVLDAWRASEGAPPPLTPPPAPAGWRLVELDAAAGTARRLGEGVRLDLGALGKGYAVDRLVELLRQEWSIGAALVHGGQSSAYGFGHPSADASGWKVAIRDPAGGAAPLGEVLLEDAACSGSGVRLRGAHIIDPRTGQAAVARRGAWCVARSAALPVGYADAAAALSDAFSTAFMLLSTEAIAQCCARVAGLGALLAPPEPDAGLMPLGALPTG